MVLCNDWHINSRCTQEKLGLGQQGALAVMDRRLVRMIEHLMQLCQLEMCLWRHFRLRHSEQGSIQMKLRLAPQFLFQTQCSKGQGQLLISRALFDPFLTLFNLRQQCG